MSEASNFFDSLLNQAREMDKTVKKPSSSAQQPTAQQTIASNPFNSLLPGFDRTPLPDSQKPLVLDTNAPSVTPSKPVTWRDSPAAQQQAQTVQEEKYDGVLGFLRGVGESAISGIRSANEAIAGWLSDVTPDFIKQETEANLVNIDADAARAAANAATGAVQAAYGKDEQSRAEGAQRVNQASDYLSSRAEEIRTGADTERLYQEAADSQEEAARIREYAVGDSGFFTQLLFDAAVGGAQLLYDTGINALLPGAGLWSAAARGAGSGILEAQQSGANLIQQLAYGLSVGTLEAATEKIGNLGVFKRIYGVGATDKAVDRLIKRLASSDAGRAALYVIANASSEGVEEFVSGILNPILRLTYDSNALSAYGDRDTWVNAAYDAIVGATIGGISGLASSSRAVRLMNEQQGANGQPAEAPTAPSAPTQSETGAYTQNATEAVTTQPSAQQTSTNAAPQVNAQEQVAQLLSQPVTNSIANRIIESPELLAAFEAQTGLTVEGTKSQQRAIIKQAAERMQMQTQTSTQPEANVAERPTQQADPTEGNAFLETVNAVNAQNAPQVQPQPMNTVQPTDSLGAAPRGFTVGHEPTYAANQEHALQNSLGDQYEGPGTHQVLPDADSMTYARQRIEADYEGEVNDLRSKQQWDAVDYDTGMLILQRLSRASMADPSNEKLRAELQDWKHIVEKQDTKAGQALRARVKWTEYSPDQLYSDAVDFLYSNNVRKNMTNEQKVEVLREVENAVNTLENTDPGDTAATIELIKRLNEKRRTTGLFSKETSKAMSAALEMAAQQEGGAEFLRNVAKAQTRCLATDYERRSFTTMIRTIRNLNMLSKIASTFRNLIGNGVFDPLESISNNTGVLFDWMLANYTGQRTTAIDKSWFSEAKRRGSVDAAVRSFIETGLDANVSNTTNRYDQGGGRTFRMTGNFAERFFSTWEKYNSYLLTTTDEFAKGGTRAEAERGLRELAENNLLVDTQEAQAVQRKQGRNILPEGTVVRALDRNNFGHVVSYNSDADTYIIHFESTEGATADVELPASDVIDTKAAGKIRRRLTGGRDSTAFNRATLSTEDYITQMSEQIAKERTFQNDTKLSDLTLGLRDTFNVFGVGDLGAGDVLIPFARIPANVGTQAINYSPAGLVNGMVQMAKVLRAARNGTLTAQQQAQAVRSVGRGITGTVGIGIFAAMALKGILKVSGSDDDDEKAFDTGEGLTGTQLNLSALERWIRGESTEWQDGDTLMSIGFLEPINAQMAMGSLIADSYLEDGTLDITSATLEGVMQSIIDLPAMSSIQELQDAWQYSSGDNFTKRVLNAALSYAGSQAASFVVPNAIAGIAAGADNTVRAPYLGETPEQDMLYQIMNDIPGLRQYVPERLNSWGQERTYTDSDVLNFLNNTIMPGAVTQYQTTAVNQELRRLGVNSLPQSSAPDDFTVDGEKVTLDQSKKDEYQRVYGETALGCLEPLLQSSTYQQLSDADKASVVKSVYEYANATAKKFIDNRYKLEGAAADAAEYDNPAEYFLFNEAWKNIENSKGEDTDAFNAVIKDYEAMNKAEQNALLDMLGENSRFDDVVNAYEAGISPSDWYTAYDEWKSIGEKGKANDNATEFANWLETQTDFSQEQADILKDQLAYYTMVRANQDRYEELRNYGFSADQALDLYYEIGTMNAYTSDGVSGGRKAKVVAHINRLNLTPQQKDFLYLDIMNYSPSGLADTPWH